MAAAAVVAAAAMPAAAAAAACGRRSCWGRHAPSTGIAAPSPCSGARGGSPVAGPVPGGAEAAAKRTASAAACSAARARLARLRRERFATSAGIAEAGISSSRPVSGGWCDPVVGSPIAACSACARRADSASSCHGASASARDAALGLGRFENRLLGARRLSRFTLEVSRRVGRRRTAPRRVERSPVKPEGPPPSSAVRSASRRLISRMAFCNSSKDMPFPAGLRSASVTPY